MAHQPTASTSGADAAHGGWVAEPARQPHLLDAWIEHVEARHQADASAAALAPAPPDLEALMQAWTPEMQAHIVASPLPDPGNAACDLPTFARMCCGVLDIPTASAGGGGAHAGLLQGLHALFALYLVGARLGFFQVGDGRWWQNDGRSARQAVLKPLPPPAPHTLAGVQIQPSLPAMRRVCGGSGRHWRQRDRVAALLLSALVGSSAYISAVSVQARWPGALNC